MCLYVQETTSKPLWSEQDKKGKSRGQLSLLRITITMRIGEVKAGRLIQDTAKIVLNGDAFTE